ncbi:MAG TPA: nuclear transport factor 2 family protein, partial [Miltoncostaeaceae bacterium]|nr:nuclear transport factor 2 family protein [Miltoncostaeaceae bacterium]
MMMNESEIRDMYEALNAGDPGPALAAMADDVEWVEPDGAPLVARTHRGPEAVLAGVFGAVAAGYDGFRVDVEEVLTAGDVVVVLGHPRAAVRETGRRAEAPFAHSVALPGGPARPVALPRGHPSSPARLRLSTNRGDRSNLLRPAAFEAPGGSPPPGRASRRLTVEGEGPGGDGTAPG